jgi:hypothetical protein
VPTGCRAKLIRLIIDIIFSLLKELFMQEIEEKQRNHIRYLSLELNRRKKPNKERVNNINGQHGL